MPGLVHPNDAVSEAISTRLSSIEGLRLPAALLRDQPYPDPAAVQQHLQDLLHRDAAVFLERYSLLLSADELRSFEPLRDNYEVDYYLKQAAAAAQQQQQQQQQQQSGIDAQLQQQADKQARHQSSTVKNRRLAFMRRLEQQGEYFSEHAMRDREPLVWQECIGRHEGQPAILAGAPAGERGFAGSLLASYDEAMLRARLQEQLEEEEAAMSEHESDDSDDVMPQKQQQQQQEEEEEEEGGHVQGQQHQQQEQQQQQGGPSPSAALPPKSISTPAAASAGRTEAAKAGAQVARAAAAERAGAQQQQQQRPGRVDMGADAMARRRRDFLLEMQHRFLDGLDGEHQDYAAIDADTTLDDDWAKQQAQDAEDAYFAAE